jgi:hypothetical protein
MVVSDPKSGQFKLRKPTGYLDISKHNTPFPDFP